MFINKQSIDRKINPVRSKFLTGFIHSSRRNVGTQDSAWQHPFWVSQRIQGFTLMEVVVGLIIFSVAFVGLIASFVGVKRYVSRATMRVTSTNLDRQILNSLYKDVRADTWDSTTTGALRSSVSGVTHDSTDVGLGTTVMIDNYNYGGAANPNRYTVQNVTNRDYRQVNVTVSYPTN